MPVACFTKRIDTDHIHFHEDLKDVMKRFEGRRVHNVVDGKLKRIIVPSVVPLMVPERRIGGIDEK